MQRPLSQHSVREGVRSSSKPACPFLTGTPCVKACRLHNTLPRPASFSQATGLNAYVIYNTFLIVFAVVAVHTAPAGIDARAPKPSKTPNGNGWRRRRTSLCVAHPHAKRSRRSARRQARRRRKTGPPEGEKASSYSRRTQPFHNVAPKFAT